MAALVKQAQDQKSKNLILYASDITDAALRESEENLGDLIKQTVKPSFQQVQKNDTIVSNPPYIKIS